MAMVSSLEDFSLGELFRIIDSGNKSGRLTIQTLPDTRAKAATSNYYYIWFQRGRVVATANRLDGKGLITMMEERKMISPRVLEKLQELAPSISPLGLYLKTQGALGPEQLNLIFQAQTRQINPLFELSRGNFEMDTRAPMPYYEMTGLSLKAIEVALYSLRIIKNWSGLTDKIPEETSGLETVGINQSQLQLNSLEWQILEYANGTTSLSAIADQLNQDIDKIQKAAFRLMIIGLVEEIPMVITPIDPPKATDKEIKTDSFDDLDTSLEQVNKIPESSNNNNNISNSFLQNLVGFLRSKV